MNRIVIGSILVCAFLCCNAQVYAQKHRHNNKKVVKTTRVHGHGPNKVVRFHKYPRNKVVVVKRRKVGVVKVLPSGYSTIIYRGKNYYHHGGYFYNNVGAAYNVIVPPVGIRIKVLPPRHHKVIIAGLPHCYYMGVFYREIDNEFETVQPAIGAVVPELPQDNVDEITIDGQTYYEFDEMLYKPIVTESGAQYELVGRLDD